VSPASFLDNLDADSEWLAEVGSEGDPALSVPACPGLTLGQLVRHVGVIYNLVSTWVTEGHRPAHDPRPASGRSPAEWLGDGRTRLLAVLSARAPEEAASTWSPSEQTIGFWHRRMAHESAIHRVDAEAALSLAPRPVEPSLATDGTGEIVSLWLGTRLGTDVGGGGRIVTLDDGSGRWHVALHEHIVEYATDGVAADATVSADPDALYRWLWGRAPLEAVEVDGDVRLAVELRAALARATQ